MNKKFEIGDITKLNANFYLQEDVVRAAKTLIGKIIVTCFNNEITAARIVETEAYKGVVDKASHAYGGRRTARTETMYARGGVAYVYLCYGIHHLFNVVTNAENIPHAVLIRAAEPLLGIEIMSNRMKKAPTDYSLTKGPGNLSKALGITVACTGISLTGDDVFIAEDHYVPHPALIKASPRIGVNYAGEDASLPYRFFLDKNRYVSGKKTIP
ncbi:MAG: DNA-3-methyladenine glycosylase [Sphingobacteriia bacterium]|nr:DNA-3-methyladenine glycosylase [Sphingobacteriia bacterium]